MGFRRRRRFTRRRRVARQYRAWDVLCGNLFDNRNFDGQTAQADILWNISNSVGYTAFAGFEPIDSNQQFTQGGDAGNSGFTTVVPLLTPEQENRHGQDFTIRAVHGWMLPRLLTGTDSEGVAISNEATPIAREGRIRFAITEMEGSRLGLEQGQLRYAGFPDIWHARDALLRRIWWMKEWIVPFQDSLVNAPYTFGMPPNNAAATAFNSGFVEPLFASLPGGSFRVRLPRFNFKVSKGRYPVLLAGVQAQTSGLNMTTGTLSSPNVITLGALSSFKLQIDWFLRAFIVR